MERAILFALRYLEKDQKLKTIQMNRASGIVRELYWQDGGDFKSSEPDLFEKATYRSNGIWHDWDHFISPIVEACNLRVSVTNGRAMKALLVALK